MSAKVNISIIVLMLVLFPCLAAAGDEQQINELLKNSGNVTLENKVYTITGPIYIHSNTVLTGGPDTVIRVSSSSSQWFTGNIGIISNNEAIHDVEIYGFSIDGNVQNLPAEYHHSQSDTAHDCERCILLHGDSNKFMNNVKIHDMRLYDSFSDGVYIRFCNNAQVYNNFISNTQHEGVFFVCAMDSLIYNNKVAGITSDCLRLDNCVNNKVFGNICFSYNGSHASNTYAGGENGIQIGNSGVSHGYDGRDKPTSTKNIEVFNNSFINNGLQAILLDSVALTSSVNVFIHDNKIIGKTDLETSGFSFDINNYSYENPPSVETSEKIFSSIFDILNIEFSDSGRTEQKAEDIPFSVQQTEQGAIAGGIKILGFKDLINIEGIPYIPDNESILYKAAAVRAPSFNWWDMGVSNISQKVTTKTENQTAYAVLTVSLEYYTISFNHITGKTRKTYHTATAVFNDSRPAPEILQRPAEKKGIITYYNNSVNPHTLVYVPSQGLIKVNYEYAGNITEHVLMIGEKGTGENSVQYTNFSTCDYWRGDIPYQGEALFVTGPVDQSKLNITCFTPYESFKVTKFEYIEKAWKRESFSDWFLPFVLKGGIILFFLWRLLKIPFS